MPQSALRLIKRTGEFATQDEYKLLPQNMRGIYVLYQKRSGDDVKCDVVYVGLARAGHQGGIKARHWTHKRSEGKFWTHFSFFEVWDNIRDEEVIEPEGLFRHIYRHDTQANRLNKQKGFKALDRVRQVPSKWKDSTPRDAN
jgi:hypothetical protein